MWLILRTRALISVQAMLPFPGHVITMAEVSVWWLVGALCFVGREGCRGGSRILVRRGQRSFDPGGAVSPKLAQNCLILNKSGGQGEGPGPLDPLVGHLRQ